MKPLIPQYVEPDVENRIKEQMRAIAHKKCAEGERCYNFQLNYSPLVTGKLFVSYAIVNMDDISNLRTREEIMIFDTDGNFEHFINRRVHETVDKAPAEDIAMHNDFYMNLVKIKQLD